MTEYQHIKQGERLKEVRLLLGKTRQEIAEELNLFDNSYGAFERGNSNFSIALIKLMAGKYKVSINYLLLGEGDIFLNNIKKTENSEDCQKLVTENERLQKENYLLKELLKLTK